VAAAARPEVSTETVKEKEGIAIVVAIDTSSTMVSGGINLTFEDLSRRPETKGKNTLKRIDAVREVARDFIKERKDDIIGIVAFASEAFIVSPVTFDHDWLMASLDRVKVGIIKDGTAIGSGIMMSLNALKEVKAKEKVIVLLSDGINNYGKISPIVAAKAARALGIKIYTVGLVSGGDGLVALADGSGRKRLSGGNIGIDEKERKEISASTGGIYFRAKDLASLRESYSEINRLEVSGIEMKSYEERVDIFGFFLIPALIVIVLEIFLSNTFFRRLP
ncbi:MAG: VWA domain-containing protein, partial [Candidatus Omnitrophica bacterium]|nr:VWA domain-containing protein [Candidatus Omnitrophota bacterium]